MTSPPTRLRLLAVLPYPLGIAPCQRFRIEQWEPWLREARVDVIYAPALTRDAYARLHRTGSLLTKAAAISGALLRALPAMRRRADCVLLHRHAFPAGPAFFERFVVAGRRVIYDFDDAIYLRDTAAANRSIAFLKRPEKTDALCRWAAAVTVGNAHLATYARRFNANVTVVPTSIDTDAYAAAESQPAAGGLRLGWTGSSTSQRHLEQFQPLLATVLRACPGVRLHVISDVRPELAGLDVEWEHWDGAREAEQLTAFDVGIMPIPDDEWSRGKCAAKALQCMAIGRPVIATPVGANVEVIDHGVNGFLATTPAEWIEAVSALASSRERRMDMGAAARRTVVERYSMRTSAALLAQVVRAVATEPERT